MEDDPSDPLRRTVLKLLGSGTAAGISLGTAGNVAAADESGKSYSPFTDEELAEMRTEIQQNANESLAESQDGETGVRTQSMPSWIPGLPSGLPFTWCLKNIPYSSEVCSFANSPVTNGDWDCNGSTHQGTVISAGVAYGPSVNVSNDDFYGDIQHEVTMDLFYDPATDCFGIKFASGSVEGCTGLDCVPNLPTTAPVDELVDEIWDTAEGLVRDMFESIGYIPPEHVIIAITAIVVFVFAAGVAISPVP